MKANAVVIEPMSSEDVPSVLAIERASFSSPWTADNFRNEIENNALAWNLVARADGRVVAFACAYVVGDELMLNDFAVDPACRRGGIGRMLLGYLIDGARARNCRRATLEVRPSNGPARSLYEAFGFSAVGVRRGYYADTHEDALLMACSL